MIYIGTCCDILVDNDFEKTLAKVVEAGYNSAEINLQILPFIIAGKICEEAVKYAKCIMDKFDLKYTAHIAEGLDIRSKADFDSQKNVLFRSIDLASMLGIDRIVVHFEEKSKIEAIEQRFYDTYVEAADYAEEKNVILCMENIEVENYKHVLKMVKDINHKNFGFTLDTGHLYLACKYFGYNFYDALNECIPCITHIHLNDNSGKFMELRLTDFNEYKKVSMRYRTINGLGDIHVPPYFGEIPFDLIIDMLLKHKRDSDLVMVCEYERETFAPFEKMVSKRIKDQVYGG
jgi:sugar phosphate isomerase/epimerase